MSGSSLTRILAVKGSTVNIPTLIVQNPTDKTSFYVSKTFSLTHDSEMKFFDFFLYFVWGRGDGRVIGHHAPYKFGD